MNVAKSKPKDNSTFREKAALRKRALADLAALGIDRPVVLETHGGEGKLWAACYSEIQTPGVVMEKDPAKAERLALQRPSWAVYECDCEAALAESIGGHVVVDLLDIDPWGSSWEAISGFMSSKRPFADQMVVVVNDGLRQALSMGAAWSIKVMQPYVEKYGNDGLYTDYPDLCREILQDKAAAAGYTVSRFVSYTCGAKQFEVHMLALLTR